MEDLPLPNAIFPVTTKPVISPNSEFVQDEETKTHCRNVTEQNVCENMVPPTLTEVGKSVLSWQFDYFVEEVPEMENIRISEQETRDEPITPMN